MDKLEKIPIRNKEFNWRIYGKGSLLDSGHALNETATFILQQCDSNKSVKEIVETVCSEYNTPKCRAQRDVENILEKFSNLNIIHWKEEI